MNRQSQNHCNGRAQRHRKKDAANRNIFGRTSAIQRQFPNSHPPIQTRRECTRCSKHKLYQTSRDQDKTDDLNSSWLIGYVNDNDNDSRSKDPASWLNARDHHPIPFGQDFFAESKVVHFGCDDEGYGRKERNPRDVRPFYE